MTEAPISQFDCPECGSVYTVARLEAPPEPRDHAVACLSCGHALAPRDNGSVLKYFRI